MLTDSTSTMPMISAAQSTAGIMRRLLACLCPGILVAVWFFGIGVILNIAIAIISALGFETIALRTRGKHIKNGLRDYSAVVTAVLLALSVPIGSPWWIVVLGIGFAIIIGKHTFGGLGQNSFNPAMCGYLFLLLSFPLVMTTWHVPLTHTVSGESISPLNLDGIAQSIRASFSLGSIGAPTTQKIADGMAMATPLIEYKLAAPNAIKNAIDSGAGIFNRDSATGWEIINIAFLIGGLALLKLRIIRWQIPCSILATLAVLSIIFYSSGSAAVVGSPYLHLVGGATMLGAFFIATDPVSAATTNGGRIAYGITIGVCIYSIRVWGSYLDAIAIAVIFANFWAPLFDILFKPTVYGHPSFLTRIKQDFQEWRT